MKSNSKAGRKLSGRINLAPNVPLLWERVCPDVAH